MPAGGGPPWSCSSTPSCPSASSCTRTPSASTPSPATATARPSPRGCSATGRVWVPYTDPGLPLARAIVEARRAYVERTGEPAPAITVMQNHGIIVGGDTAAEIDERSGWLACDDRAGRRSAPRRGAARPAPRPADAGRRPRMDAARARDAGRRDRADAPRAPGRPARRSGWSPSTPRRSPPTFTAGPAGRDFVLGGPLTPDQIVYAGSWPLLLDLPDDDRRRTTCPTCCASAWREHVAAHGAAPIIVVVPRLGLFAAGDDLRRRPTPRATSTSTPCASARAPSPSAACGPSPTPSGRFIEAWEVEAYRRDVAAGPPARGRFAGKVALVTGAAQGFGLAIAADLVAEGGHVVLADVNAALAESNARDLEARHGPGRATAVAMNVMDEQSVADGFHADGRALRRPRPARLERGRAARRRGDEPAARRVRPGHAGQLPRLLPGRPVRGPDHGPPAPARSPTTGATSSRSTPSPGSSAPAATAPTRARSSAGSG